MRIHKLVGVETANSIRLVHCPDFYRHVWCTYEESVGADRRCKGCFPQVWNVRAATVLLTLAAQGTAKSHIPKWASTFDRLKHNKQIVS